MFSDGGFRKRAGAESNFFFATRAARSEPIDVEAMGAGSIHSVEQQWERERASGGWVFEVKTRARGLNSCDVSWILVVPCHRDEHLTLCWGP